MYSLWMWIYYYLRPILKWFLRKTTGLCELQRICYGEHKGAPRTKGVENSLSLSKNLQIKQLRSHLNDICDNRRFIGENGKELVLGAVSTVLLVKKINPSVHPQFVPSVSQCLEQMWGYRQLLAEVEELRKTPYNDMDHQDKLCELWTLLMPHQPLESRVSEQWQEIGFQGDDPKTDFRGMGLLGLENLIYFVREYKSAAIHVLSHSRHSTYGYPFAIVGINLTSIAYQLLKEGEAKTYVYNMSKSLPELQVFHQFYSYLFIEFDKHWLECKPKNIMEFSSIRDKFESNIRTNLQDSTMLFRINLLVDTV